MMIQLSDLITNDIKFQAAREIIGKLKENKHEAFIVGGAVRDLLLKKNPDEFDICTSATPEEIQTIFNRTKAVGQSFGVILVLIDNVSIEVATFRKDMVYTDGRHPDKVIYTKNVEEDIERRDFTINGLLLNPDNGEVFDYCKGIEDIKSKIIRTIGIPDKRFSEDYLRMLRAIRFSNRFGFKIEQNTSDALLDNSEKIMFVSIERIREEVTKIITKSNNPGKGIISLSKYGLLKYIIPEVEKLKGVEQPKEFHPEGDVFVHTCLVLDMLDLNEKDNTELAYGALLHDIGKPETQTITDRIRFNRHEYVGAKITEKICKRLKFSNKQKRNIESLVKEHMKFANIKEMKKSTFKKFISMDNFEEHLALHKADCLGSHGDLELYDYTLSKIEELKNEPIKPKPLVTGDDLILLGLTPGPKFKEILSKVFDEQLEGNFNSKEEGVKLVKDLVNKK
ncbi:MAG: CCA tRNA nucleotidyltransferase [Thermodesulfobacteriota bacterium]|nr:CCA tRNA nucleotidyltransferase [Thermodesulfobacteriota bacterium]|tara:strand:+ start:16937 stop:18292 length:1356 start_codon:yes stop_codon:yes gene_type:complete